MVKGLRLTDARWRGVANMLHYHMIDSEAGAATLAANLAIGTTTDRFQLTNATKFLSGGVLKVKAATDDIAWSTGHQALNPGLDTAEKCIFLISMDSAGAVTTTQSAIVPAADDDPDQPAVPASESPVGFITVETSSSVTFVPDTTLLGAAGITDTYTDESWPTSGDSAINFET